MINSKVNNIIRKAINIKVNTNAMTIGGRLKLEGEIKIYITELGLSVDELYAKYPNVHKDKIFEIYRSIIGKESVCKTNPDN